MWPKSKRIKFNMNKSTLKPLMSYLRVVGKESANETYFGVFDGGHFDGETWVVSCSELECCCAGLQRSQGGALRSCWAYQNLAKGVLVD